MYTIHTLIQSLQIISPPATWWPKKIFFNIQGRQVAGETSDLVGCVCVCAVCVCRLVVLFHFLCLSSLPSIHSFPLPVQLLLLFSFPAGAALLKGELSLYPSIHPFFSNPVVTDYFLFFPLCSLLVDWLEDSWGLFNSETIFFLIFFCCNFFMFFVWFVKFFIMFLKLLY